jgi:hypothetical protein
MRVAAETPCGLLRCMSMLLRHLGPVTFVMGMTERAVRR